MASISKRGNKWHVRICRKNSPTICKTFALFKDAQTWAKNIELQLERGEALGRDTVQLCTLIERYLSSVAPAKKGYKQEIPRLRAWLQHPIAKREAASIKPADIAVYRDQRLAASLVTSIQDKERYSSRLRTRCVGHMGFNTSLQSIRIKLKAWLGNSAPLN